MNLKCYFLGHDIDIEAIEHGYPVRCSRCGRIKECWGDLCDTLKDDYYLRVKGPIRMAYWKFKAWLRPCSECGERFGRHDGTVEHLPF